MVNNSSTSNYVSFEIMFVKCNKFATNFLSQIQGGFDIDTKLATIQIRTKQWASIIQDCRSSGLKVDDYCGQPVRQSLFSSDSPICERGLCRNQSGYTHAAAFTSAGSDPPCLMTLPVLNGFISVSAIPISGKELTVWRPW